jgi:transposase-like protein
VSKRRVWRSREFKLAAIARMETAPSIGGLAAELGIRREMLLKWRHAYEAGGAEALCLPGQRSGPPLVARPAVRREPADELTAAWQRIAELERKVGQQQLDVDFFRAALRHIDGQPRPSSGAAGKASTR